MATEDARIVAVFKMHTIQNEAKSQKEGRPIFDEMEVCEIRFAGDRNRISVFPARDYTSSSVADDGSTIPVTYAERFSSQYQAFKAQTAQVKEGTPLSELTFLTAAQRSELKALHIHTVETLASLDGVPLKSLGMYGRNLVTQAQAYIAKAQENAVPAQLVAENEELKRQIEELKKEKANAKRKATIATNALEQAEAAEEPESEESDEAGFDKWSDDDLREFIKSETGTAPRGNPSHDTLVRMAKEAQK